jgi:hypothetical protein
MPVARPDDIPLGDAFHTVALTLLVDRTGSGLGVAGVVAAEIVPVLLLAPTAPPDARGRVFASFDLSLPAA